MTKEEEIRIEAIAHHNWLTSLNKKGLPKNLDGTVMDCWQLYDYWNTKVDKTSFIIHAKNIK